MTEDGGVRWRKAFHCPDLCYAVAWESPRTLVVGTHIAGDVSVSKDRGRSFRRKASLLLGPPLGPFECVCLTGLSFGSGGGWALTGSTGVWHAPLGDGPWTPEPSALAPSSLLGFAMDIAVADFTHGVAAAATGVVARVGAGAAPPPAPGTAGRAGPPALTLSAGPDGWSLTARAGGREAVVRR